MASTDSMTDAQYFVFSAVDPDNSAWSGNVQSPTGAFAIFEFEDEFAVRDHLLHLLVSGYEIRDRDALFDSIDGAVGVWFIVVNELGQVILQEIDGCDNPWERAEEMFAAEEKVYLNWLEDAYPSDWRRGRDVNVEEATEA